MELKGFTELTNQEAMDINGGFSIIWGDSDLGQALSAFSAAISSAAKTFHESMKPAWEALSVTLTEIFKPLKDIQITIG